MLQSNKFNLPSLLLLLAGEILILLGFYWFRYIFVVPGSIYLDLVVFNIIYFLAYLNLSNLFTSTKDFESNVGGLGISWFFISLYSIFALVGILVGVGYDLSFKIQLLYQSTFLFLFASGIYVASLSNKHAIKVSEDQLEAKTTINTIQNLLQQIHISFSRKNLNWEYERKLLEEIAEKCRIISPSDSITAKDLEAELISELELLMTQFVGLEPNREIIQNSLVNCENLITHRKKLYTN